MSLITSFLDRRYPRVESADFDAWERAARVGDVVSQYRLGRSLLDSGIHSNLEAGRRWLWLAAAQDFAPAKYWIGLLAKQGLVKGAKPGASWLWAARAAASALRTRRGVRQPLQVRLKPLGRSHGQIKCGERHKLPFAGRWKSSAVCAVEVAYTNDGHLAVMLQSLHGNSGTSVTNMARHVAFRALMELILDGYDPQPEEIEWFEVWPAGSMFNQGRVHRLMLHWDNGSECYRNPTWQTVTAKDLPFDVSHAVRTEEIV